jgi:protein TonB
MEKRPFYKPHLVNGCKKNRKHRILFMGGLILLLCTFASVAVTAYGAEYDASEVDSPPKLVRQMPVTYPSDAKRNNVEGRVVVRVLIGIKGKAEKMEIVESEPEGVFDENVMKSLKYWQFRPGIKEGDLVATWVKVPFTFSPDGK